MAKTGRTKAGARMPSWTLTDAKAKLSRVVERALEGQPQRITRAGREAVVVVSEKTFEVVTRAPKSGLELFGPLRGAALDLRRDRDEGPEGSIF